MGNIPNDNIISLDEYAKENGLSEQETTLLKSFMELEEDDRPKVFEELKKLLGK